MCQTGDLCFADSTNWSQINFSSSCSPMMDFPEFCVDTSRSPPRSFADMDNSYLHFEGLEGLSMTEAQPYNYQPMNFDSPFGEAYEEGENNFDFHAWFEEKENKPPPISPPSRQNFPSMTPAALKVIENVNEPARMAPERSVIYKSNLFTGTPTRFSFAEVAKQNTKVAAPVNAGKKKKEAKAKAVKKPPVKKRNSKKAQEPDRPPSYIMCLKCMRFLSLPLHSHSCERLSR